MMQMLKFTKPVALGFGLMALSACQQPPVEKLANKIDMTYVELGQDIAKANCAACHSIEPSGPSPRADAPPLRTVFGISNPESLADDFREHIHVGHADMPDYDFTVKETDGLLAYLSSIQTSN